MVYPVRQVVRWLYCSLQTIFNPSFSRICVLDYWWHLHCGKFIDLIHSPILNPVDPFFYQFNQYLTNLTDILPLPTIFFKSLWPILIDWGIVWLIFNRKFVKLAKLAPTFNYFDRIWVIDWLSLKPICQVSNQVLANQNWFCISPSPDFVLSWINWVDWSILNPFWTFDSFPSFESQMSIHNN